MAGDDAEVHVRDGGLQMRKKKKRAREITAVGSGFEEHNCCRECGKRFGSPKALYGHMRCHPERWWRGINPPLTTSDQADVVFAAAGDDDEVADSLLMLSNGSVVASKNTTGCGFLDLNSPAPVEQLPRSACSSSSLNLELSLS